MNPIFLILLFPTVRSYEFKKLNCTEKLHIKLFCGRPASQTHFKVAGPAADISEFPWVAKIESRITVTQVVPSVPDWTFPDIERCSGTIISNRHILTAAHCLCDQKEWLKKPGEAAYKQRYTEVTLKRHFIDVRVGGTKTVHPVKGFYAFYLNKNNEVYDFAILELKKSLGLMKIRRGAYRPLCFTNNHAPLDFGLPMRIAGYGDENIVDRQLRYQTAVEVTCPDRIGPSSTCYNVVTESGDSGSGYFISGPGGRYYLTGVLSGESLGVDVATNAMSDDPRGPLHMAQELIGLDYAIRS